MGFVNDAYRTSDGTVTFVHQLFDRQCADTPENTAIQFGDHRITYAALNEQANYLSAAILARFPTETIISISTTRNIEMVVGVLAILKAGKAYLPLDPRHPKDRLSEIIGDAGISICLSPEGEKTFFHDLGLQVFFADADDEVDRVPAIVQSSVAYVLYTSGSTGKPKGVCMGHAALVNLLLWQKANSIADSHSNTLQFAPLSFDVSFQEIFASLTTGGTLILIEDYLRLDPYQLLRFIDQNAVQRLFLPFVALQQLAIFADLNNFFPECLKEVMTAGEQLKITPQIRRFFSMLPGCTLYNQYGPTETHVVSSVALSGNPFHWPSLPSIGKAIDHTHIYILDDKLNMVPDGETGEICVGGVCLSEGYLNNPGRTNERFIHWQHPTEGSKIVYRTGDLGRYLADGSIEFAGRLDEQIKIRGHRVEPGEIEYVLNQLASIRQAVVTADEDIQGQKRLIAYVVSSDKAKDKVNLREALQDTLPEYMMPSVFVWLDSLPKTSSGKIDKKALPKPAAKRRELSTLHKAPVTESEKQVAAVWSQLFQVDEAGTEDDFFESGGNSLLAVAMVANLKKLLNLDLPITKLYQYPTIAGIANYFSKGKNVEFQNISTKRNNGDVAVIGLAGRFPGADTIEELWELLKEGRETIQFFSDNELHYSVPETLKNDPAYVKARGILSNADQFDAAFFGLNPKVAELMDPQQRIFLEIAWEVLEQTGHLPGKYNGSIGVFAGSGNNSYYLNNVLSNKELIDNVGSFQVMTVNEKDYIATRVAYQLNLKGPAVSIYSGCSTSLLAIAQAAESIRNGKCSVALAGGVSVHSPIHSGQYYEEGAMFSPDGRCRPFDKDAKGTVFSDGAGVVLLKSLEDAIKDSDTVYAVIRGVGYNNDGAGKASFTAPSAEGQAGAIVQAINDAGIQPSMISYIETHGTATPLGDPIEIEGLQLAFGSQERNQFCAIGSLKSNMGHLTAAAGVAGFIKTALSLYHKQLPPSLHYREANPNIQFQTSPFFVNTSLTNWEADQQRIAGVSSFGVGGTNVHVVLAEFENISFTSGKPKPFTIINWSAKTEKSREDYALRLHRYIADNPSVNIADVAYTLQTTRPSFNCRRFLIAGNHADLLTGLIEPSKSTAIRLEEKVDEVAFLFPGQGSQYANMGLDLYLHNPVFKEAVDECAAILEEEMNEDIRKILYQDGSITQTTAPLDNTYYTQPALFATEYAIAKLWMSWGIKPSALTGHSIGEFVAAHLAGIFSLKDALKLVVSRAGMMSETEHGRMLSVQCSETDLLSLMPNGLSVAAINSSRSCVVAGDAEMIGTFAAALKEKGIASRGLNTSHAFHSSMMDKIVGPFERIVQTVTLSVPKIPIVSTVTGKWLSDAEATSCAYWSKQLRATVRFADAVSKLCEDQKRILLEVGPGNTAATLARSQLGAKPVTAIGGISKSNAAQSEYFSALQSLGQLWLNGVEPDWKAIYSLRDRKRVLLPPYSFTRKKCWVEPLQIATTFAPKVPAEPINAKCEELPVPKPAVMRKESMKTEIFKILEDASGIDVQSMPSNSHFMEMGLDSLSLTQISISLKKRFHVPVSFRQLIEEYNTVDALTDFLDKHLPQDTGVGTLINETAPTGHVQVTPPVHTNGEQNATVINLIAEQIKLLSRQVALLQGEPQNDKPVHVSVQNNQQLLLSPEDETEIKKPFGATARIQKQSPTVTEAQQIFIRNFIQQYNNKTPKSKAYTQKYRASMADPRVVSGFQPLVKEIVYPIVVNKSNGCRLWDIDNNEYIDALNGFGSNLLGYQNDWIKKAVQQQIENGYEIGPQHELAGEVCSMICDFTGLDRAALCNTGSEAVLGAIRIARTVTGRSTIVSFNGSYHGIIDEVIVRGSKSLKSFPAAAGIMPGAVENILVLEYGTEQSLEIIRRRAHEFAAVLVEPVQSRRPDFVPIGFLKELRKITEESGTALIFDEVITGFRMHPGGVQTLFDIKADLATYGKVVAGGMPIGVIAGRKKFMDALDGGSWQYGDDSIPEVGVTYFAGTFVRHPLALAAAKASLEYMKIKGPDLQRSISAKTKRLADDLNAICEQYHLPLYVAQFGSLWKFKFKSDLPYSEMLFPLLRFKGIHIWDLFPCFITESHTESDIDSIIEKFREAVDELIKAKIFPSANIKERIPVTYKIVQQPPVPGAKLGKDELGNPGWFVIDPDRPGKFLQVVLNEN